MRKLYGYWRSSASYRIRIALALKGLAYETVAVDLRSGQHRQDPYLEHNPQGLVPLLEDGERRISQSMAILEYLEERYPHPPLLPADLLQRARVRSLCALIACEIHPLNNLRVLQHLRTDCGWEEDAVERWYRHWIREGFALLERELRACAGRYCVGDRITMADVFLVPQVYNARRFCCPLDPFPTILRIDRACQEHMAFAQAHPDRQPDAPGALPG